MHVVCCIMLWQTAYKIEYLQNYKTTKLSSYYFMNSFIFLTREENLSLYQKTIHHNLHCVFSSLFLKTYNTFWWFHKYRQNKIK